MAQAIHTGTRPWPATSRGATARFLELAAGRREQRRAIRAWLRRNPPSVGRETGCRV
jgi:hypothetical protein